MEKEKKNLSLCTYSDKDLKKKDKVIGKTSRTRLSRAPGISDYVKR